MYNCLIMGSGRSGTSMVAGVLASSKYFMGNDLIPAREANPKGFFESTFINHHINEAMLSSVRPTVRAGHWWVTSLPLDTVVQSTYEIRKRIREMVKYVPFCYKDPRFCYTLPMWLPFLIDTKFICVFRHPASTIASMVKERKIAKYMHTLKFDEKIAEQVWCSMYKWILDKHCKKGDWLFVHYDQVIEGPGMDFIAEFLDSPVDRTFPSKKLKKPVPNIELDSKTINMYSVLCELSGIK